MACFLECFGGFKDNGSRKHRKKRHGGWKQFQATVASVEQQATTAKPSSPVPELRDKTEEGQSSSSTRKRVTFDSNVTTYEHVQVDGSVESLPDIDKASIKKEEERGGGSAKKSNQSSSSISEDDSTISSVGSYPPNHRYQNCRDSDDELEDSDDDDCDLEDEEEDYGDYSEDEVYDGRFVCEHVWSESITAESMESRTGVVSSNESLMDEAESPLVVSDSLNKEEEARGNARDRSTYVHPVLNPIENFSQWKEVKSKRTPHQIRKQPEKENYDFKSRDQEVAVDASLSTWLSSKKTVGGDGEAIASDKSFSQGSKSVTSFDDRPILGAMTVEELKQLSASNSPRKSPCRSPDEMPIIGSVGTYWNNSSAGSCKDSSGSCSSGIPNTTSKYGEDKKVNWHTTPFEARLEKALLEHRGATEA